MALITLLSSRAVACSFREDDLDVILSTYRNNYSWLSLTILRHKGQDVRGNLAALLIHKALPVGSHVFSSRCEQQDGRVLKLTKQ